MPDQLLSTVTQTEVNKAQTIFGAKSFVAFIDVTGEDSDGNSFSYEMMLDSTDPEFRAMMHEYGTRKSLFLLTPKS